MNNPQTDALPAELRSPHVFSTSVGYDSASVKCCRAEGALGRLGDHVAEVFGIANFAAGERGDLEDLLEAEPGFVVGPLVDLDSRLVVG